MTRHEFRGGRGRLQGRSAISTSRANITARSVGGAKMRACAVLLAVAMISPVQADWPQFRGPTGQGLASGPLPVEWGPDRNVRWKTPIPGLGWSSPVVAGGRVFLTTAVPEG